MSWCHRFKISLRARHIPGCLNVIADSLSRSTQIQSMESPSGVQKNLHKVVHTSGGSVCHSAKPQVATICLSSSKSKRIEHRYSKHKLVKPCYCSLCLPSNSSTSKSNAKGPPVQLPPNPDSPGLAGHALVLGSGPSISGNSISVACISKSTQAVKQPGVSQQSAISPCLVSRSEQLQEQGFSSEMQRELLPLKGHQQDLFTKQSGPSPPEPNGPSYSGTAHQHTISGKVVILYFSYYLVLFCQTLCNLSTLR